MDIPAMFRRAVAEFDARVRQIGDHQWQAATPDEGWTVRDLVNHLVSEDLWAPPLLAGSTIAEIGDRFEGDVLGAEPKAAWAAASAGAVRAVEKDGAMDRIVHLSFGDFPGSEYTLQLFADHLIHAWDLARTIGADERLDAGLVASCANWFEAVEDAYRSAGAIAARPPVPGDANAQTLLLAHFGRRALRRQAFGPFWPSASAGPGRRTFTCGWRAIPGVGGSGTWRLGTCPAGGRAWPR
jgi:uncharacterized protein (TIGR03086 family)